MRDAARGRAGVAAVLLALAFAGAAGAETLKIGGTGSALATVERLAQAFARSRPAVEVELLPSLGSTAGIKAVTAGALDVGLASRALKSAERAAGATEVEYGRTPLVFAVAKSSTASEVRLAQLVAIYAGSTAHWPDGTQVRIVLRPAGEADTAIIRSISTEMSAAYERAEKREGLYIAPTDQSNADALENIPGAIGTITLAQIIAERRQLRALRLDGVTPRAQALRDGSYPYSKTMYLVTGPKASALARDFVAFARSPAAAALLSRTGHFVRGEAH